MKLFAPRITGPVQRLWVLSLVSLALLGGTSAQAGHHVEDAWRESALRRHFRELEERERRLLGGLDHDGIACGECGSDRRGRRGRGP